MIALNGDRIDKNFLDDYETNVPYTSFIYTKGFTKEQLKETTAYQAMERIGMLYKAEKEIRSLSVEEIYIERQKQSKLKDTVISKEE